MARYLLSVLELLEGQERSRGAVVDMVVRAEVAPGRSAAVEGEGRGGGRGGGEEKQACLSEHARE